jgi:FtsZ-binding cell division protein ZapB
MGMITNSEAIIVDLKGIANILIREDLCSIEPIEKAISALEENTKLKAEIEQLKEDYNVLVRQYDNVENSSIRYYNEAKQLKLELEQSIKLPCNVGDKAWCITSDQYDYITEPIECTVNEISINIDNPRLLLFRIDSNNSTDGWTDTFPNMRIPNHMNIRRIDDFGKTVFITREEAEQALKGKVKE